MALNLKDALNNIKEISVSDSSLATLLDYERVIDELSVYTFKNWKLGELVEGPIFEKYFITAKWMYPYKKMPDPRGGEQLLNYNCEVLYEKEQLEIPVKVKSANDFKPGTKVPKTKKVPVWVVTITIPKSLMDEIQKGVLDLEGEQLDLDDLDQAYEGDLDNENQGETPNV